MGDKKDEGLKDKAKGRAKEAAGAVTGDDETKREGKKDQMKGDVKEKAGEAKRKLQGDD